MCTNAYVMERIERFMAKLRSFKKVIAKQMDSYLRGRGVDVDALARALEVEEELIKVLDYVGILMKNPEEELVKPIKTVSELVKAFLRSPSRELAHEVLAQLNKIPI